MRLDSPVTWHTAAVGEKCFVLVKDKPIKGIITRIGSKKIYVLIGKKTVSRHYGDAWFKLIEGEEDNGNKRKEDICDGSQY